MSGAETGCRGIALLAQPALAVQHSMHAARGTTHVGDPGMMIMTGLACERDSTFPVSMSKQ